jgi:hypothetical protein
MSNYYDGGRRVVRDGVPCKVFSRPASAVTRDVRAKIAHVLAGTMDWSPVDGLPGFSFTPPEKVGGEIATPKALAIRAKARDSYYAGGCRVVIDGVPVRLASKPTRNRAALLRQGKNLAPYSKPNPLPMREEVA